MVVGLNDHRSFDANRSIQTSFSAGTQLVELTGNPGATPQLVVGPTGRVDVKVSKDGSGRGYGMWGPKVIDVDH